MGSVLLQWSARRGRDVVRRSSFLRLQDNHNDGIASRSQGLEIASDSLPSSSVVLSFERLPATLCASGASASQR